MKKFLSWSLFASVSLTLALSAPVAANTAEPDEMLAKDTVVCFANEVADESLLAVVGEYFWAKKPNARKVDIAEEKTICIRYRGAKEIKPFFYAKSDLDGENVKPGAKGAECQRTKGGFAKYYVLRRNEKGRKVCEIDRAREQAETREIVRGRKAL